MMMLMERWNIDVRHNMCKILSFKINSDIRPSKFSPTDRLSVSMSKIALDYMTWRNLFILRTLLFSSHVYSIVF